MKFIKVKKDAFKKMKFNITVKPEPKCKHKRRDIAQEGCAYCGRSTEFCLDCKVEILDDETIIA